MCQIILHKNITCLSYLLQYNSHLEKLNPSGDQILRLVFKQVKSKQFIEEIVDVLLQNRINFEPDKNLAMQGNYNLETWWAFDILLDRIMKVAKLDSNRKRAGIGLFGICDVLQRCSAYAKYMICLNDNLPKEIYDKIKNNLFKSKKAYYVNELLGLDTQKNIKLELYNCIMRSIAFNPKKNIIEDISNHIITLTQRLKTHWSCGIIRRNNIKKQKTPLIMIMAALHALDYDTLLSKKQAIKDHIAKVYLNESIEDMFNQIIAYINTLHKRTITTTDQEIGEIKNKPSMALRSRSHSACG